MKKVLVLAAAIVIAAAMLPISVAKLKSYDRTVDVKGLCEREVKADKAIWPMTYKVMGDDLASVLKQTEANNRAIIDFLVSGGIPAEQISIAAPTISDKLASEYGTNDRYYRFMSTNVVTVCSEKIDEVLALQARQSELMKKGIAFSSNDWENRTQFKFEALNDIKPEMIEEETPAGSMSRWDLFFCVSWEWMSAQAI